MLFIYDDSITVPTDVSDAIGINNFGSLLYRKKRIKKHVLDEVAQLGFNNVVHISDINDAHSLLEQMHKEESDRKILYYPSNFFPLNMEKFRIFLSKIQYSDDNLIVSDHEKSIAFMTSKDFIHFLNNVVIKSRDTNSSVAQDNFKRLPSENYFVYLTHYASVHDFLSNRYETRYFNEIVGDKFYITKSSQDIRKIRSEHHFYYLLPEKLQVFFVKPFDLQIKENVASYTMERLNIPDFAVQWIHDAINEEQFNQFLDVAFYFINQRPQKMVSEEAYLKTHQSVYVDKLYQRIEALKKLDCFDKLNTYIAQGTSYPSIEAIYEKYISMLGNASHKIRYLSVSHGDFCFSNILYDKRLQMFRLIDPKGAETEEALYMEPYYDIAKLSHSILGGYDYINHGFFDMTIHSDLSIALQLNNSNLNKKKLQQLFIQKLEQSGFDYRLVRLYEASLFLSMLPLHSDNMSKMLAFALRATQILDELE